MRDDSVSPEERTEMFVPDGGVPGTSWSRARSTPRSGRCRIDAHDRTEDGLCAGLGVAADDVFRGVALFLGKEVIPRYRSLPDPRAWFRGG